MPVEEGEAAVQLVALKFIYYFLCECAQVCCCICVEVRRQLLGISSLSLRWVPGIKLRRSVCMAHANSLSHCAAPVEGFILILNFIILYLCIIVHMYVQVHMWSICSCCPGTHFVEIRLTSNSQRFACLWAATIPGAATMPVFSLVFYTTRTTCSVFMGVSMLWCVDRSEANFWGVGSFLSPCRLLGLSLVFPCLRTTVLNVVESWKGHCSFPCICIISVMSLIVFKKFFIL